MIEIYFLIKLVLIFYIATINYYNFNIIFNLFRNTTIKNIILFLIFIFINFDYNISILLTISYVITNEYINLLDYKNLIKNFYLLR
jgi:hypothetical protein